MGINLVSSAQMFPAYAGMNRVDAPEALFFKKAIAFMKSRVPVTKDEWTALEPKLRFRAFTVAALSSHDGIEQVRRMITSAIDEGKDVGQFWTEARALDAAGRAAEFAREQPEYLEFVGIDDGNQSDICYALTHPAIILPTTHPFWKTHWPPLHFKCRSTVRGIYSEEMDQIREENPEWKPSDVESLDQEPVAKGFGGNPIETESFYQMTPSMVERAREYGIMHDIEVFAESLGIKRRDIEIISAEGKKTMASPKPRAKKTISSAVEISFSAIQDARIKTMAERAFKNAPDEVRTIVAAHIDDFSYRLAPPRGRSYYSPSTKTIVVRRSSGPDVFVHEFGHGLDYEMLSSFIKSAEFKAAFNEDLSSLIDTKTGTIFELGERLKQDMVDKGWENLPAASDLFSGLTCGRIQGRWGHPMRYWHIPGRREVEVFADLFTVKASGDTALWSELSAYASRTCKAVEDALARR